jgi:hypothetical protein
MPTTRKQVSLRAAAKSRAACSDIYPATRVHYFRFQRMLAHAGMCVAGASRERLSRAIRVRMIDAIAGTRQTDPDRRDWKAPAAVREKKQKNRSEIPVLREFRG